MKHNDDIVRLILLAALWLLLPAGRAGAAAIRVAVASNFQVPAAEIAARFEAKSGAGISLVPGATGRLYAQIVHGAPFAVFLAADKKRPRLLEERGAAIAGSRFTYAIGRLVLWSPAAGFVDPQGKLLATGRFRHLALASPSLAPYGRAAAQALRRLGLWERLEAKMVFGENIGQAFQFVASGNAELGFVAASRLIAAHAAGSSWPVPEALHDPIEQQAVLLQDSAAARAFLAFLKKPAATAIIRRYGYAVP